MSNGDVVFKDMLLNTGWHAFSLAIQIGDFRDQFAAGVTQLAFVAVVVKCPSCGKLRLPGANRSVAEHHVNQYPTCGR